MHIILDGMELGAVMGDGLVDAARRVLFACVGVRNQEHPDLRQFGEFLHRYSLTQVSDSGEVGRCGTGDQPVFEHAPTRFGRRRNGVGPYVLHDAYEDAVLRAGGLARARIDLELLHKAVPESWVPIVAALIAEGPDIAAARAHAAIFDYSKESVTANRRRTAGTRSRASVQIVLSEAHRLFSTIHSLRTLPACQRWVQASQLHMPDMPKGGYEVVAPRVETVRQAWQDKSSEIHERLGIRSIEEEMEALNSLSDNAVCCRGLWRPARDRAILVLMVLTGGRRTALARLKRKDYVRDCEGSLPDCRRGAALDLLPRKNKGRDEVRRKPIPAQAALVLDFYLEVMDRMAAANGRPPASPDAPLLVAEPAQLKAVQEQWLYRRVAGSRKYRPLVPRDPRHTAEHTTDTERAICGYTPHEYRHFANKLAERAGEIWNERHPATGGEANPPIQYYAAALLDNGSIENDLRALYGDRRTPAMLEVVSGRAAEIGWEILTTDAGLRKRPDCQAYEREMIRLRRIEDEERRLEQDAQTLQARHVSCGQQALLHPPPAEDDRLDRILSRQEEMVASIGELKEIMLQSSAITHQLIQLSRQKAGTIVKLDLYRLDRAHRLGHHRPRRTRQTADAERYASCSAGLADLPRVLRGRRTRGSIHANTLGQRRTHPDPTRQAPVGARTGSRRRLARKELPAALGARRARGFLAHQHHARQARRNTRTLAPRAGMDNKRRRTDTTMHRADPRRVRPPTTRRSLTHRRAQPGATSAGESMVTDSASAKVSVVDRTATRHSSLADATLRDREREHRSKKDAHGVTRRPPRPLMTRTDGHSADRRSGRRLSLFAPSQLQAPSYERGQLDEHVRTKLALSHSLFDEDDHFIGVQASPTVGRNVLKLAAADHVAHVPLIDTQDLGHLERQEHQSSCVDRHAIYRHVRHEVSVLPTVDNCRS
jgi:hypothetical protein